MDPLSVVATTANFGFAMSGTNIRPPDESGRFTLLRLLIGRDTLKVASRTTQATAQGRQCLLDRPVSGRSAGFDSLAAGNVSIGPMNGHRASDIAGARLTALCT